MIKNIQRCDAMQKRREIDPDRGKHTHPFFSIEQGHSRDILDRSGRSRAVRGNRTPMKYFISFCTLSTLLYQPANHHHHDDERSYYVTMDDHVIEWRIGILILSSCCLGFWGQKRRRFCLCLSIRQAFCLRFSCLHGLLVCNCTCLFFFFFCALHCIVDSDNPFLSFVRHRHTKEVY